MSYHFGVVTLWEFGDRSACATWSMHGTPTSVQRSAPARLARLRTAAHAATCWLRGRWVQTRGAAAGAHRTVLGV